eukprot:SAG31_NODE_74_length_27628_cov_18.235642_2_plen_646_part_00
MAVVGPAAAINCKLQIGNSGLFHRFALQRGAGAGFAALEDKLRAVADTIPQWGGRLGGDVDGLLIMYRDDENDWIRLQDDADLQMALGFGDTLRLAMRPRRNPAIHSRCAVRAGPGGSSATWSPAAPPATLGAQIASIKAELGLASDEVGAAAVALAFKDLGLSGVDQGTLRQRVHRLLAELDLDTSTFGAVAISGAKPAKPADKGAFPSKPSAGSAKPFAGGYGAFGKQSQQKPGSAPTAGTSTFGAVAISGAKPAKPADKGAFPSKPRAGSAKPFADGYGSIGPSSGSVPAHPLVFAIAARVGQQRIEAAAAYIQAAWRATLAKPSYHKRAFMIKAVCCVQTRIRSHCARTKYLAVYLAVVKVQAAARGCIIRRLDLGSSSAIIDKTKSQNAEKNKKAKADALRAHMSSDLVHRFCRVIDSVNRKTSTSTAPQSIAVDPVLGGVGVGTTLRHKTLGTLHTVTNRIGGDIVLSPPCKACLASVSGFGFGAAFNAGNAGSGIIKQSAMSEFEIIKAVQSTSCTATIAAKLAQLLFELDQTVGMLDIKSYARQLLDDGLARMIARDGHQWRPDSVVITGRIGTGKAHARKLLSSTFDVLRLAGALLCHVSVEVYSKSEIKQKMHGSPCGQCRGRCLACKHPTAQNV